MNSDAKAGIPPCVQQAPGLALLLLASACGTPIASMMTAAELLLQPYGGQGRKRKPHHKAACRQEPLTETHPGAIFQEKTWDGARQRQC